MAINKKTISIKTQRLIKASKVRIMKSRGAYYIEALPAQYYDNLSADELNEMYIAFIKLGRTLYKNNKNKNIFKIELASGFLNLDISNTLLRNNPINYITDNELKDAIRQFNSMLNSKQSFNLSTNDYILLKGNNLKSNNMKLKQWLLDNFVPNIDTDNTEIDATTNKYWLYADDGTLIDMAIFFYLVTYSIINVKKKFYGKPISKSDPVTFSDFVIDNDIKDDKLYIGIVNDIIYLYEKSHLDKLYGYNKLSYDYSTGTYKVVRQYENLYGILWHIFKLYLSENYDITDKEAKRLRISICEVCGNPILGNKLRCEDCNYENQSERQQKCRKEKLELIDKLEDLIKNNNSIPTAKIKEANEYIKMNKTEKLKAQKKEIDKLFLEITSYIAGKENS